MNIPDTATLRRAIAITTKIERLQEQLRTLLAGSSLTTDETATLPKSSATKKKSVRGETQDSKESMPKTFSTSSEPSLSLPLELEDPQAKELLLMEDGGQEQLAIVNS